MKPELPSNLPDDPAALEHRIAKRERAVEHLKPDAHARIVWADPENKKRTPHSVVYLHGFTASQGEGHPVHLDFARRYGCNLYLSRLTGHGIADPDAFTGIKRRDFLDSAAEAFAIGRVLGNGVIVMGTSTGASLALYLASEFGEDQLTGLILYSPLVEFYGIKSWLLANRWTRAMLKRVLGESYMVKIDIDDPDQRRIWYDRYRLEGVLALGSLIEKTMTETTFERVTVPAFVGYYYKNWRHQDRTVSVRSVKKMFKRLGAERPQKQLANFPDAGSHIICSSLLSNSVKKVENQTYRFSENVLGLNSLYQR
ncbi:MAG: alpha/beta hydrolase [Balneolaceae bacterium]|nr:alpha/beta hydrolase [Balneolaceae bacterium]